MKPALRLLRLNCSQMLENLKLEEKILRHNSENWCIFSSGPIKPTIVLGMSAKVDKLVDIKAVARDGVQMIRRFTGGGTVIVDESTVFITFIMNSSEITTLPYPRNIMKWTEDFYSPVFKSLKTSTMFSLRENDYVFDDLKFGGNAQNIMKDRWLHHTSFLWDYRPSNMQYLLMPEKKPDYRSNRDHGSFITSMNKYLPEGADVDQFYEAVYQELNEKFSVSLLNEANVPETLDLSRFTESSFRSFEEHVSKYILESRKLATISAKLADSTSSSSNSTSPLPSLVAIGPSCGVNH